MTIIGEITGFGEACLRGMWRETVAVRSPCVSACGSPAVTAHARSSATCSSCTRADRGVGKPLTSAYSPMICPWSMRVYLLPHPHKHRNKSLPSTRKCEQLWHNVEPRPRQRWPPPQLRPWSCPRQRSVTWFIAFPGPDSTFHSDGGHQPCASMLSSRMDDTTPVGLEGCSVRKWPQRGSRGPLAVTGVDEVDV